MARDADPTPASELILYRTEDRRTRLEIRLSAGSVWLTQRQMAELFQVAPKTISEHLQNILEDGECEAERTIRKFRIVQSEGARDVRRDVDHYALEAILAVGYRVRSPRGVQFRQWRPGERVARRRGRACGAMKTLAALLLAPSLAFACREDLPLEGTATIPGCDPATADCVPALQAVAQYFGLPDDDDTTLSVGLHSSPWRMYDADLRILSPAALAERLRPHLDDRIERVELAASWSGVAPEGHRSLAAQLADVLGDLPVEGADGFLWVAEDGRTWTTRQEFSLRVGGGYYLVERGADVFVPLAYGWASSVKDRIAEQGDAVVMLMAGVGDDVFMLCPEEALASFERAAAMGSAIGAYNAARMRFERGEREAALALWRRGAELGDAPSAARLAELAE